MDDEDRNEDETDTTAPAPADLLPPATDVKGFDCRRTRELDERDVRNLVPRPPVAVEIADVTADVTSIPTGNGGRTAERALVAKPPLSTSQIGRGKESKRSNGE